MGERFGALVGRIDAASISADLTELGAAWVRVNLFLNSSDDLSRTVVPHLAAGRGVILTIAHRDLTNIDKSYCANPTSDECLHAGFPFVDQNKYQQGIKDRLNPLLPYVEAGRVWAQCENEVVDASMRPNARYWRGTTAQYLSQLAAFAEAVRSVSSNVPVVLTSFSSGLLEAAVNLSSGSEGRTFMTTLLTSAPSSYDAVDLHFYGCLEDIPAKIAWVKAQLPVSQPAKRWISTENGGPHAGFTSAAGSCPRQPTWDGENGAYEQTQAEHVRGRLAACADAEGSICLWFSFADLPGEVATFAHMGLLDATQAPARKKPAYGAFSAFTRSRR